MSQSPRFGPCKLATLFRSRRSAGAAAWVPLPDADARRGHHDSAPFSSAQFARSRRKAVLLAHFILDRMWGVPSKRVQECPVAIVKFVTTVSGLVSHDDGQARGAGAVCGPGRGLCGADGLCADRAPRAPCAPGARAPRAPACARCLVFLTALASAARACARPWPRAGHQARSLRARLRAARGATAGVRPASVCCARVIVLPALPSVWAST